jgi:hypothetical protein
MKVCPDSASRLHVFLNTCFADDQMTTFGNEDDGAYTARKVVEEYTKSESGYAVA